MPESSSGLSLAIRLQAGSGDAWRDLVNLYGPLIESWCRQAGLPEAARADVGQEVFLSVHRGITRFDPRRHGATFRGWLWAITRNAVMLWLRKSSPAQGAGGSTAQGKLLEIPDPWGELFSDEPPENSQDTAQLISRALEQIRPEIEPHTWQAFWRTTIQGHSAPEAAAALEMSPTAVRQAKSRVLRRLRKQLGDAG